MPFLCSSQIPPNILSRETQTADYFPMPFVLHCARLHYQSESLCNTVILFSLDQFSHSVHLIPLLVLPATLETMELIFNCTFRYNHISEDVASNKKPHFTTQVWFHGQAGGFGESHFWLFLIDKLSALTRR